MFSLSFLNIKTNHEQVGKFTILRKCNFTFSNPLFSAYYSYLMFFDNNVNFKCHLKFPFCYMHRSISRRLKCHSWEKSIFPESNDRKMTDKAVWMFIHGHIINVISTSARVKSWNISLDRNKFLVKERVIVFYYTLRGILYNSYSINISIYQISWKLARYCNIPSLRFTLLISEILVK